MSDEDIRNEKRRIMKFRESAPPPLGDHEATVRWLRDREVIKNLYRRYAYGVDSIDFDLVRSVFHPDCVCVGTAEKGGLDDYLDGMEEALHAWDASMHFVGNQYVEINGDEGFVESWVVGYHMEAEGSPLEHLVLGLRYQDDLDPRGRRLEDHPPRHREAVAHRPLPAPLHRARTLSAGGARELGRPSRSGFRPPKRARASRSPRPRFRRRSPGSCRRAGGSGCRTRRHGTRRW